MHKNYARNIEKQSRVSGKDIKVFTFPVINCILIILKQDRHKISPEINQNVSCERYRRKYDWDSIRFYSNAIYSSAG